MSTSPSGRFHRFLAGLIGMALAVSNCGGSEGDAGTASRPTDESMGDGDPVAGGVLVDLQNFSFGDPAHIDPALSSTVQGSQPGHLLFDGLTEINYQTGEIEPAVAQSWESNETADQWTFHLRPDVTFHNGDPVLPSDFKFAWERVVSPDLASRLAYHFDPIVGSDAVSAGPASGLEGVVADDESLTLTVRLEHPYAIFPATTSHLAFSPVPRSVVESLEDQSQWERQVMIGNGPFRMAEPWADGRYIRVERFDDYWGGVDGHDAYLDAVEFRISADVDSAYLDFQAGRGQTAYIPPGRFREAIDANPGHHATEETLGTYYFGFNMDDPVVGGDQNRLLRQAIALAIDKPAIVDAVYGGGRRVATGHTPPAMPGYREGPDDIAGAARPDPGRSRELLEQWGGELTDPIRLSFDAGSGHEPVAQIVQANLAAVGIPTVLDGRDPTTYFTEMAAGEGQLFRAGWVWDYVAYDNGLYPQFHTASLGGDNLVKYSNPVFDDLVDRARATLDTQEANGLYRRAETIMLGDVAIVPITWYTGQIVYDESIRNFGQSPLQYVAYDEIWRER